MTFRGSVVAFCACVSLTLCSATARAQELTEQAALSRFAAENQILRALEANVRVAQAEALRAGLLPNPAVTYNREDAAQALDNFVLVQQTLPLNGRLGLARRAGNAAAEAAGAESAYQQWLLTCNFRAAFYSLLLAQEREAGWDRGVTDFQEALRILRERESAGEGSRFDRLRAEREMADVQAERAAAQAQRALAQSRLAAFFSRGTSPASLRAIGEMAFVGALPPLDELVSRALSRRGDRQAESKQVERYDYERRAAERQRIPDPTVTGGLKHSRFQTITDNGYAISVSVPLTLFNHGQADIARARASSDRSNSISQALEQQIRAEVQGAYAALEIRMQAARDYGRDMGTMGSELSRIAQSSYQEGEQNILQLLDAYRVALQSNVRALELQSEARIADIELDRAVGEGVMP